jgi:hypothetical protein
LGKKIKTGPGAQRQKPRGGKGNTVRMITSGGGKGNIVTTGHNGHVWQKGFRQLSSKYDPGKMMTRQT